MHPNGSATQRTVSHWLQHLIRSSMPRFYFSGMEDGNKKAPTRSGRSPSAEERSGRGRGPDLVARRHPLQLLRDAQRSLMVLLKHSDFRENFVLADAQVAIRWKWSNFWV